MTESDFINSYQQIKKAKKSLHTDLSSTWEEYSYISSFIIRQIHEIFDNTFQSDNMIGDLNIDIYEGNIYITTSHSVTTALLDQLKDFLGVDAEIRPVSDLKSRIQIMFSSSI